MTAPTRLARKQLIKLCGNGESALPRCHGLRLVLGLFLEGDRDVIAAIAGADFRIKVTNCRRWVGGEMHGEGRDGSQG